MRERERERESLTMYIVLNVKEYYTLPPPPPPPPHTHTHTHSLTGMSPFLGDDDMETIQNISSGEYEYPEPEEDYEDISDLAKSFIDALLEQVPR